MKNIITTLEYNKKTAQTQGPRRYFGTIQVEIFVPNVSDDIKMQQMADEALKRAAWDLKFKKIDISLDHELSDPQSQAEIGEGPIEVDVQMSGHKITGAG